MIVAFCEHQSLIDLVYSNRSHRVHSELVSSFRNSLQITHT